MPYVRLYLAQFLDKKTASFIKSQLRYSLKGENMSVNKRKSIVYYHGTKLFSFRKNYLLSHSKDLQYLRYLISTINYDKVVFYRNSEVHCIGNIISRLPNAIILAQKKGFRRKEKN